VRKGFLGALKLSAFGERECSPRADTVQAEGGPARPDARDRRPHEPDLRLYSDPKDDVLKSLRSAMAGAPDMAAVDDLASSTGCGRCRSPRRCWERWKG